MTKGAFRIPVYGGTPDPATYCPANGYILNPINPADGWFLIAEFQTNSPNTTTFDPSITASSGEYAWDLGDGTYMIGDKSVSHTYLSTATRTVKLYGKGTCNITAIDINNDYIIGIINLSNDAFITLTSIDTSFNTGITGYVWPSSFSGSFTMVNLASTGITGTLDLSMFASFTGASIYISSNPGLTNVTFASSITGIINNLSIYSTGITGTLDLSMFTSFGTNTGISIYSNPSITSIIFAATITGTISSLSIYSTGVTGTLDLSMFTTWSNTALLYLNNNTSMSGVTFPSSTITGFIRTLRLYSNTALGYVDFTKLRTGVNSLNWDMKNNGWTAAIVNQVLVNIDGISAAGFTSRVINIGGTNTDPDTTSGGYDGVAARNSLISKAFTVTIT